MYTQNSTCARIELGQPPISVFWAFDKLHSSTVFKPTFVHQWSLFLHVQNSNFVCISKEESPVYMDKAATTEETETNLY